MSSWPRAPNAGGHGGPPRPVHAALRAGRGGPGGTDSGTGRGRDRRRGGAWLRPWLSVPPGRSSGPGSRPRRNVLPALQIKKAIVEGHGEDTERSRVLDIARSSRWPAKYPGRTLAHPFLDEWRGRDDELAAGRGGQAGVPGRCGARRPPAAAGVGRRGRRSDQRSAVRSRPGQCPGRPGGGMRWPGRAAAGKAGARPRGRGSRLGFGRIRPRHVTGCFPGNSAHGGHRRTGTGRRAPARPGGHRALNRKRPARPHRGHAGRSAPSWLHRHRSRLTTGRRATGS